MTSLLRFLRRHWPLFVLFAVTLALSLWEPAFTRFGAIIYLPVMCVGASASMRILIHIGYGSTLDADSAGGRKVSDWNALTSAERACLTTIHHAAYFIGCAIIAAALAK